MKKIFLLFILCFSILSAIILLAADADNIGKTNQKPKITAPPIRRIVATKSPTPAPTPAPTEVPKELYPVLSFNTESMSLSADVQIEGRAIKFLSNNTLLIDTDGGNACIIFLFDDYGLLSVQKDVLYRFYGTQWIPTEVKDNDGFRTKLPTLLIKYEVERLN